MLSSVSLTNRMSCVLAPLTATPIGAPAPSARTERLLPDLARSVGFGPVFFPTQRRLRHGAIETLPRPLDPFEVVVLFESDRPQLLEDPRSGPLLEVTVKRTALAVLGSDRLPLTARAQNVEDPVGHLAQISARPAAHGKNRVLRKQWLHPIPELVR